MRNTLSLPLLLVPLWLGVVVSVRVPSIGKIPLFNNYLYLKSPCAKEKKIVRKNVNMNVQ